MRAGEVYENPVTGERMEVVEATGERLLIDFRIAPGGAVPAEHVHLTFAERFDVVEGEVHLRIDGEEWVARRGESRFVERGVPHAWWNGGDVEARVTLEVTPPARFADMIGTMFQLARDGDTNAKGMPSLLQVALLGHHLWETAHLARPPLALQRLAFAVLAPVARLRGYEPLRSYRHEPAVA